MTGDEGALTMPPQLRVSSAAVTCSPAESLCYDNLVVYFCACSDLDNQSASPGQLAHSSEMSAYVRHRLVARSVLLYCPLYYSCTRVSVKVVIY